MEEEKTSTSMKIRNCPHCHQTYEIKTGINNWKNLFKKPTTEDWITLFILIMIILASFAYTTETKQCKETLTHLDTVCLNYNKMISNYTENYTSPSLSLNPEINDANDTNDTIGGETYK